MSKQKKISFILTRIMQRKVKVKFFTKDGKSVYLKENKDIPSFIKDYLIN